MIIALNIHSFFSTQRKGEREGSAEWSLRDLFTSFSLRLNLN